MLALKYLLMTGGFGMMLAALSILGFDLYREILYRRALSTPGATVLAQPKWRWRTSLALGVSGVGTDSAGPQHRGGSERDGGSSREPNQRHAAGNAVSRGAFCDSAGGGRGVV